MDLRGGAAAAVEAARRAQPGWAAASPRARAATLRRLRRAVAARCELLVEAVGDRYGRTPVETLSSEIIPFADALRFLEREAPRLLAPRRLGRRGRPLWLWGSQAEVRREALGVVLIVAPSNYRLLLAGVQAAQALAAGNAALVKPAPGCAAPMAALAELLAQAGLPAGLFAVLGEDPACVEAALDAGVDRVAFTGSAETGRRIAAMLAPRLVPAALELSGNDAAFVLPGADLELTARALAWGAGLNGGAACIAPRRVFVIGRPMEPLIDRLAPRLEAAPAREAAPGRAEALREMVAEAEALGARRLGPAPEGDAIRPTLLRDVPPEARLLREDPFAPALSLIPAADAEAALALAARCPYALGASVFGPEAEARALAARIRAGVVTANDVIAPTIDPRLPFGGRGESGYGVTRGAEGLLEMTAPKAVILRRGRSRPHYGPGAAGDAELFRAVLRLGHGRGGRLRELGRLGRALARRRRGAQRQ